MEKAIPYHGDIASSGHYYRALPKNSVVLEI